MSNLIIYTAPAKPNLQDDIVSLWKQAVVGDASARQAFLRRVMPEHALDESAAAAINVLEDYRKSNRAAA